MRFSQSTHLLMCLSLETFNIHHNDCLPVLVEQIDLVNSVIIFLSQTILLMVNFPTWIPDCNFHSPALLDISVLLTLIFVLQWFSLDWEIPIMLLSQFPLTFQTHKGVPHFITWLMTILMPLGTVFLMI